MKTFPEYFQDSIDMTDGSVTITEKDYKAIQLDASQSGYERGVREAANLIKNRNAPEDCQTCLAVVRDVVMALLNKPNVKGVEIV